jgi:HK97 family phage prohead protease
MDRAYSVLVDKSFDESAEFVTVRGIASTPTTDRMGDIVEPMGARFTLPMKLLLQHDHHLPVGNVTFAQPTPKGIPFEAQLPIIKEAGRLKDRVDEAIHSLKYDLISAVSIGFKAVADKVERIKETGGLRFREWSWLELSLVTIPANAEAVITAVKSIDREHLPSAGREGMSTGGQQGARAPATPKAAIRGPVKLIPRNRK